jgi:hypothetical protein
LREQAPEELARSMDAATDSVLSHADLFAANVVRLDHDGKHKMIDPNPTLAPRAFDAAKWITSTSRPTNLVPLVEAWTAVEPLDAAQLATCLSVQLWRHAGINEICKPIRDRSPVEKYGVPEAFVNAKIYDVDTDAMVKTSIALRTALANGEVGDMADLLKVLRAVPGLGGQE